MMMMIIKIALKLLLSCNFSHFHAIFFFFFFLMFLLKIVRVVWFLYTYINNNITIINLFFFSLFIFTAANGRSIFFLHHHNHSCLRINIINDRDLIKRNSLFHHLCFFSFSNLIILFYYIKLCKHRKKNFKENFLFLWFFSSSSSSINFLFVWRERES
mgnify:CR=1 FL=1